MWNINPVKDQALRLATNRTVTGPMYDFVSGTLQGLAQFLASERALLDSLEAKYSGAAAGRDDWEKVRGMLTQRITQLETGVAELQRVMGAVHGNP